MKINRGVLIGVIVIALVVGGGATYYYLQIQKARPWYPKRNMTGYAWMKMNQSEKWLLADGYNKGHFEGVKEACDIVSNFKGDLGAADPKRQAEECLFRSIAGRVSFPSVAEQVSKFYELYPEERSFKVVSMLQAFSDGETIEEFLESLPEERLVLE